MAVLEIYAPEYETLSMERPDELALVLARAVTRWGLRDRVVASLTYVSEPEIAKAAGRDRYDHLAEPVPERWMRQLNEASRRAYRAVAKNVAANVGRYLDAVVPGRRRARKSLTNVPGPPAFYLDARQTEELVQLIEANWRAAIYGVADLSDWDLPARYMQKYAKMGMVSPDVDLLAYCRDALSAGRLSAILDVAETDALTYDAVKRMAEEKPWSRWQELTWVHARDNAAQHMKGLARRTSAGQAEDLVLQQNRETVRQIVAAYERGELKPTLVNRQQLRAQEMGALELPGRHVSGWRELARELRNRMLGEEAGERDWMRLSVSETRANANIGYLTSLLEQGHPPEETEIYYLVQPTACEYCVALYLLPDGTPRRFTLKELLVTIYETGGMNVGRKASRIGDAEEGWVANALVHPWCQCRPMRLIPGTEPLRVIRQVLPRRG